MFHIRAVVEIFLGVTGTCCIYSKCSTGVYLSNAPTPMMIRHIERTAAQSAQKRVYAREWLKKTCRLRGVRLYYRRDLKKGQ